MKILINDNQFYGLIKEGSNRGELYHFTTSNIKEILKNNTINLSSNLGTVADEFGGYPFFLSLSRSGSSRSGYGRNYSYKIVFDGDKLTNNYKLVPYDYWQYKNKMEDPSYQNYFEYEDRLLSKKAIIEDINKYIIRIDVIKDNPYNETDIEILRLAKSLGVPIFFYENIKDFELSRNNVNDKIESTYGPFEERYVSKERIPIDILTKIVTIVLYDKKYFDNYDELCQRLEEFISENDLPKIECSVVYDYIGRLVYSSGISDFTDTLLSNLHNYFKSGSGGPMRKWILMLTREMRKYKVGNIRELINIKVNGRRSKMESKKYSDVYCFHKLGYNYDTQEYDIWEKISNDERVKDLQIYFNTKRYNGQLLEDDWEHYAKLLQNGGTNGQWIDYLMNRYTLEKAKEIVNLSGFDNYYKKYMYKLDKK